MSVESELDKLRRELKAEQKRGFDSQRGLLNLIRSTAEKTSVDASATPYEDGSANHPLHTQTLTLAASTFESTYSSASFLGDESRVGVSEAS